MVLIVVLIEVFNQSINQSKALISVGQNVTDYSVRGKIKTKLTLNCVTGCQVVVVIMTSRVEQTTVQ